MATRNIVPRADGEGQLGTTAKRWLKVETDDIHVDGLTASRAVVTDGDKDLSSATTTAAEIEFLSGVTSSVQEQINNISISQLTTNLDMNEKLILYEFATLTSNETASGDGIIATAGENLTFGNLCYLKSDGKFWKADSSVAATSKNLLSISLGTINADASGNFLRKGLARFDTWDWSEIGIPLYVSETAGSITETAPETELTIVRIIGYVRNSDYIWFDPAAGYLEN
jgi:hypothetical protein